MKNNTLHWISRHELNDGQIACIQAKYPSYDVHFHDIVFSDNPITDLKEHNISVHEVILAVMPITVFVKLLSNGYTVGIFQNNPKARRDSLFTCKDLTIYHLDKITGNIDEEVIACPISVDDQEASQL